MRKTIASLEHKLASAQDDLKFVRDENLARRQKQVTAEERANALECQLEEVRRKADSDRWSVNSEQYRKGILEGYQRRVREEDAKSLGKLWYESLERDQLGNPVFR